MTNDPKTMTFPAWTSRRRHLEYSWMSSVVESDVAVGWDPMGYVPSGCLAYIPWTLAPFGTIPIGPRSSSSKDRPSVIKITSLTHTLTHPSLTTPPLTDHLSAASRHVILSLTHDSHDTSQLSHDPNNIHDHLIISLCNGIWPLGESVSVKGSTESAVL